MNQPSSTTDGHEVIEITEESILVKLIDYQLEPERVFTKLTVNTTKLSAIEEKLYLVKLHAKLNSWQPCSNIHTFTQNINQLVSIWQEAIQQDYHLEDMRLQDTIHLLRCFEIKSFTYASSAKFHCFILDLLAETNLQLQNLKLDELQNFDPVTQLPNANLLPKNIEKAVAITQSNQFVGLFSIQLQLSKNNPIFSNAIAASLSKSVAELLQTNVPTAYEIHANGNLQFDIVLPNLGSDITLNLLAAKLQRAFEQMLHVENQLVLLTPHIGCAYALKAEVNAEDLLADSRLALDSALTSQQSFLLYSNALKTQLSTQNTLEKQVLGAFANDNLTLFLQPVVNLKDTTCAGAELLLRVNDQSGFKIHPGLMVELLNKLGRGKLFTRWLINSACRFAAELKYEQKLSLYLTLNLRAEDLYDLELPYLLLQAAALWKISPADLVLEVTENGVLELNETSNSVINELAKNGFKLALDDFGTGFSSLSRLRNMPIDIIKIDQTFVRDITQSQSDYEIVKSIAALANSLGKEVIAEGVEDEKSVQLIKKMKISKCQGYYFAKPMPFDQFVIWAKKHQLPAETPA